MYNFGRKISRKEAKKYGQSLLKKKQLHRCNRKVSGSKLGYAASNSEITRAAIEPL